MANPCATFELETCPDVVCGDCDQPLPPGAPIGEAFESMADDKPVVVTVCVYCAMGARPANWQRSWPSSSAQPDRGSE